ncbi:beta-N-acetylhexosaminidase [Alteromonas sediminis]|uniref:N-acetyl-beta-glucosaminidase n=1 Tax=Alteromonas sediminis TaxID=2259342 RepID=A0A3N5Y2D2_9ALTE|nr:family 20 glycosylhydrolase [Alteromonas sediminis]RPJ68017.1 beta-N-acetylhexosaminidase [Alteromonas sediminis]
MLTRFIFIFLSLSMSGVLFASTENVKLMPWPKEIRVVDREILTGNALSLTIKGPNSPRLKQSTKRFIKKATRHLSSAGATTAISINIEVENAVTQTLPHPTHDESYTLNVSAHGVDLTADTELGAMRGLQTLLQLFTTKNVNQISLPLVQIKDSPRFSWRGLLLDPARRFIPVEDIKRQLDGMESAKLNVFHWHLTDDQGWRVESKRYPKLHQLASDGQYYTQDDMREIVQYAYNRGIRVVPEIDVPGHGSAIAVAYPELMSAPGPYKMERHWGVHEPTLNPINDKVYAFIEGIVEELSGIFPDPYFHIGGDEVNPKQWNENPTIQAFIEAHELVDYKGLQAYFNQKVNDVLTKHGKIMVGWDEIYHPDLPHDILIQSWRGHDSINHKAKNNRQSILSTGYYVDQPQPTAYHYRNDPIPIPEVVEAAPRSNETWQTWSFHIPRLRGAAITGTLTLFSIEGDITRGFIDFKNRSRKPLNALRIVNNEIRFDLDTWMGPFQGQLRIEGNTITGTSIVGNGRYSFDGKLIAGSAIYGSSIPKGIQLAPLTEDEQALVLGGEATLWGEIVTPQNIDLRLWPRTYAIAERLWSPRSMQNEAFMYQRLVAMSEFADSIVGLKHNAQMEAAFKRLMGNQDITPLMVLSEAVEQAQYYHRHHAKSQADEYHQQAPLNRYVDALPAESLAVRELEEWIVAWLANTDNDTLKNQIVAKLNQWHNNATSLESLIVGHKPLASLLPIVKSVAEVSTAAKLLVDIIRNEDSLSQQGFQEITSVLKEATLIREEIVVSAAYPIEKLLHRAANVTIYYPNDTYSQAFTANNHFTTGIEGPAVDSNGLLYAVNYQHQGTIGQVTKAGQASLFLSLPEGSTGNGIKFGKDGTMYIADYTGHNILRVAPGTREVVVHAHNSSMNQPNDIAITQGDIIFASDPNWAAGTGQLWRIMPDGTTHLLETNMGTTNGIAVCTSDSVLYVNESVQRKVWAYDLSSQGHISNKRLFYQFSDHGLDGMRCDSRGNLYIARYGAGQVTILRPDGTLLKNISLGGPHPTNVAFGGKDGRQVFVTMQSKRAVEYFTAPYPGQRFSLINN